MSRVKRVADRRAMERTTDEYITRGYRLTSEGETSTRLKERDWGDSGMHVLIALFTAWWSLGFFNALYAVYSYVTAEEVLITVEDDESSDAEEWEWVDEPKEGERSDPEAETRHSDPETEKHRSDLEATKRSNDSEEGERGDTPDQRRQDGTSNETEQDDARDGQRTAELAANQGAGSHEAADGLHRGDARTTLGAIRDGLLQTASLFVAGLVLLTIFCFYLGLVGRSVALLTLPMVATAVALRYVAIYHPFASTRYRRIATAPLVVAFLAAGAVATARFHESADLGAIEPILQSESVQFGSTQFLPRWWVGAILAVAGLAVLVGSIRTRDFSPYPRPSGLREIATSPPLFGGFCTIFGLWSVLFVGISLQRVLVFAPIFEELLKFGLAILVGSALFGRSTLARVGVAIVVGALFGLVEHATTYPAEADTVYLFRTVFHATLTVLSVSVYTAFDDMDQDGYRWIAPAASILLHFTYNSFAVLSSIIGLLVFGTQSTTVVLAYGTGAIVIATAMLVLVVARRSALVAIYTPLQEMLSGLR